MSLTFVLSYFHKFYGPKILESIPARVSEEIEVELTRFLSLSFDDKFLEAIFMEDRYKIINLPFIVPSKWARGNKEYLMISIILEKNYKSELFEGFLKDIVDKIKVVPEIFKAFYKDQEELSQDPDIDVRLLKLREILGEGYLELKNMLKQPGLGLFLILGLSKVGKTSILENLKTNVFNPDIKPTFASNVLGLFLGNYNFRVVDVSGQKKLRAKWWDTTKKPDAIIFVVDLTDPLERLEETKEEFFNVLKRYTEKEKLQLSSKVPLLICANKTDLIDNSDEKESVINELLELDKCDINFKVQLTSASTGEGIKEGFKWIFQELLKFA